MNDRGARRPAARSGPPRRTEERGARPPRTGGDDRPARFDNGPAPRRRFEDRPARHFDDRSPPERGPRRGPRPDDLPYRSVTKYYPLPGTPQYEAQQAEQAAAEAAQQAQQAEQLAAMGGGTRPKRSAAAATTQTEARAAHQSWSEVADWYQEHLEGPDTFHAQVIAPGLTRLLEKVEGRRLLDVGCGEGYFSRHFQALKWKVTGVDIAAEMVVKAKEASSRNITYVVDDASRMNKVRGQFDAAISVLAIQNIELADRVLRSVAERLVPGGTFVLVTLHPAFRIPQRSHWGWDEQASVQYRRMDQYLSQDTISIVMHPGAEQKSERTLTYHRPLSWYVNALIDAGFQIDRMEEWVSHRESQPGPRARAENMARTEFPMFLTLRVRTPRHEQA